MPKRECDSYDNDKYKKICICVITPDNSVQHLVIINIRFILDED